jgi:hypothetical protein
VRLYAQARQHETELATLLEISRTVDARRRRRSAAGWPRVGRPWTSFAVDLGVIMVKGTVVATTGQEGIGETARLAERRLAMCGPHFHVSGGGGQSGETSQRHKVTTSHRT